MYWNFYWTLRFQFIKTLEQKYFIMQEEAYLQDIDLEVNKLQDQLKTRLVESQNLSDLNQSVLKQSFKLEESTFELKKTSVKTKWKWFWEYVKWLAIAASVVLLFVFLIFGNKISIGGGKASKSSETGGQEPSSAESQQKPAGKTTPNPK